MWSDGTPWGNENWRAGEPNNAGGKEDHVEMNKSTGDWNDAESSSSLIRHYICQSKEPMRCDPKNNHWSCCSDTTPCGVGEGDCDRDSHCAGDLKCGKDNCPAGHGNMDCCTATPPMRCDPKDNNWSCCSDTTPCGIGEGDCDKDSHCAGDLKCGQDNYPAGHPMMDTCVAA